jgi:hypothetical protein
VHLVGFTIGIAFDGQLFIPYFILKTYLSFSENYLGVEKRHRNLKLYISFFMASMYEPVKN